MNRCRFTTLAFDISTQKVCLRRGWPWKLGFVRLALLMAEIKACNGPVDQFQLWEMHPS